MVDLHYLARCSVASTHLLDVRHPTHLHLGRTERDAIVANVPGPWD